MLALSWLETQGRVKFLPKSSREVEELKLPVLKLGDVTR